MISARQEKGLKPEGSNKIFSNDNSQRKQINSQTDLCNTAALLCQQKLNFLFARHQIEQLKRQKIEATNRISLLQKAIQSKDKFLTDQQQSKSKNHLQETPINNTEIIDSLSKIIDKKTEHIKQLMMDALLFNQQNKTLQVELLLLKQHLQNNKQQQEKSLKQKQIQIEKLKIRQVNAELQIKELKQQLQINNNKLLEIFPQQKSNVFTQYINKIKELKQKYAISINDIANLNKNKTQLLDKLFLSQQFAQSIKKSNNQLKTYLQCIKREKIQTKNFETSINGINKKIMSENKSRIQNYYLSLQNEIKQNFQQIKKFKTLLSHEISQLNKKLQIFNKQNQNLKFKNNQLNTNLQQKCKQLNQTQIFYKTHFKIQKEKNSEQLKSLEQKNQEIKKLLQDIQQLKKIHKNNILEIKDQHKIIIQNKNTQIKELNNKHTRKLQQQQQNKKNLIIQHTKYKQKINKELQSQIIRYNKLSEEKTKLLQHITKLDNQIANRKLQKSSILFILKKIIIQIKGQMLFQNQQNTEIDIKKFQLQIIRKINSQIYFPNSKVLFYQSLSEKQFIINQIQKCNSNKKIIKTKNIYFKDPLNQTSIYKYIIGMNHILIIVRLKNGQVIAVYISEPIYQTPQQEYNNYGKALLFSVLKKNVYHFQYKQNQRIYTFDPFHLIIGKFDFRTQFNPQSIYSSFGTNSSGFNSQGKGIDSLFGSLQKEQKFTAFEVYQMQFQS